MRGSGLVAPVAGGNAPLIGENSGALVVESARLAQRAHRVDPGPVRVADRARELTPRHAATRRGLLADLQRQLTRHDDVPYLTEASLARG